jgi:hypothetical protein
LFFLAAAKFAFYIVFVYPAMIRAGAAVSETRVVVVFYI